MSTRYTVTRKDIVDYIRNNPGVIQKSILLVGNPQIGESVFCNEEDWYMFCFTEGTVTEECTCCKDEDELWICIVENSWFDYLECHIKESKFVFESDG